MQDFQKKINRVKFITATIDELNARIVNRRYKTDLVKVKHEIRDAIGVLNDLKKSYIELHKNIKGG